MSQYKIEAGTAQHIGDRKEQQDRVALFAAPKAPGYMMAVLADGMGGLTGGAIAAEQVIQTARQNFERFSPLTDSVETMLETIAEEAHTVIRLSAMSSQKEPHSTMVVLVLTPDRSAIWTHVGDSRLYHFAGPNCVERTVDHSYVEGLIREGKLTEKEARNHPMSSVLVNVLGLRTGDISVPIRRLDGLRAGHAFLLCSDGLWHYFTDLELGAAIAANPPRQAAELLIDKARDRAAGTAADNCSMAIVKLVAPPKETKDYTAKKIRRAV
ncbi:MAG TPA: protein phosphatase 2C domain-containing protein [Paucimonas sp.]|nr:protein phosphatase 2C domain-containing protein [Paucimonas sp.]